MHIILLLFYISFCVLVAYAARNVTIGFWGVLLMSLFLTPLLTAILIIILRPKVRRRKDYLDYLDED